MCSLRLPKPLFLTSECCDKLCNMIRAIALPVILLTSAIIALAADQQSNSNEPGEFDIEPPILKQNLSDELAEAGTPDGDVARCEKKLERAKRNATGAERLWKIGVLAKVEVEQRALKVIKCEAELASARVTQAKETVAEQESRAASGESTKQELEVAETALAQLTETEQKALAKRESAELEFAEANLRRQQRLLKLGSAHKSDVTNAEERLAELKAPKN
jgi:multidrug resistance efflux pump